MENIEKIKDVGEVLTEKITISSRGNDIDIKSMVTHTVIYEDIFSNVMTGHVVIQDALSLITHLPLSGLETITFAFRSPGFISAISKTFYITSVDERQLGEKEQAYAIHFISTEALVDNVTTIGKKLKGKTDDIINKIFDEHLKQKKNLVVTERHVSDAVLVSPSWSPLKVINWLCNRSYANTPNVLFFEGNKNFYLSSVSDLMTQTPYGVYSFVPTTSTDVYKDFASKYNNITKISPIDFIDVFKGQDYGYYASSLITHDITLKEYKEFTWDHHTELAKLSNRGTQVFPEGLPRNFNSHRSVRTKQYKMFDETPDPFYERWAMQRNSFMYEAQNLRFVIEVPGKTDIEVGKTIECVIPKSTGKDNSGNATYSDYLDPYLSGKYVITSIRHSFLLNKHEMLLEIMKDSFNKPLG